MNKSILLVICLLAAIVGLNLCVFVFSSDKVIHLVTAVMSIYSIFKHVKPMIETVIDSEKEIKIRKAKSKKEEQ